MDDLKARKLREKLGISATDRKEAAGKSISPNLRKKISGYSEVRREFCFCGGDRRQLRFCAGGWREFRFRAVTVTAAAGSHLT